MTLHRKTLVIIGATLLGLLVAFFFLTRFTLLRRFADHENQQARQQVQRASTALDNEIAQLNTISVDDASWDAAYDFVQQPNASFLNSNFPLTVHVLPLKAECARSAIWTDIARPFTTKFFF